MDRAILQDRKYQTEVVNKVVEYLSTSEINSVLIESPVGSGKNIMGLKVVAILQQQNPKLTVNWVACRQHILKQTEIINKQCFKLHINYVSAFEKTPPRCDLCVLDEAHHEATNSCIRLYKKMENSKTLGLSATPQRTDRMKLTFKKSVKSCSIAKLIEDGFLSPYKSYKLAHYDPITVANVIGLEPKRFGKTIDFFKSIKDCSVFKNKLLEYGIACHVVTGSSDKDKQIEDFETGKVQVIANVSVLTEGFDVPDLNSVFLKDASKLPCIQMAGRGLRKSNAKEYCNLIQSSESKFQVENIATPIESFRQKGQYWLATHGDTLQIEDELSWYKQRLAFLNEMGFKLRQLRDHASRAEIINY